MAKKYLKRIRKPIMNKAIREEIKKVNSRKKAQEHARVVFTNATFAERNDYNYVRSRIIERIDNQYEREAMRIASQKKGLDGFQFFNYYKRILRRIIYDSGLMWPARQPGDIFNNVTKENDATVYTLDFADTTYTYRLNLFYDAVNYIEKQGPISYAYLRGMNTEMCRTFDELVETVVGNDYDIYEGDGAMLMSEDQIQLVVVPPRAVAADDDGLCVPRAICRGIFKGVVPINEWDTKKYFKDKSGFAVKDTPGGKYRYELHIGERHVKKINACDKRKVKGIPTSADIVKHFLFSELKVKQYKPEDYMQIVLKAEERFDIDIVTYTDESEIKHHTFNHKDAIFILIKDGHANLTTSKVPRVYCYDCKGHHYDGVTYDQYLACEDICEKCKCKKACRLHNCANVYCETCQKYLPINHKCDMQYCDYCGHKRKVGHTCYMHTETKKIESVDAVIVDCLPENPEEKTYYSKNFKQDVMKHLSDPGVQILRRANEFYELKVPGKFVLRDYHKVFGDADATQIDIDLNSLFNYTTIGSYCYDQLLKSLEEKIERYDRTSAMMKGGRLEVFKHKADGHVEVWDYSSMYPSIMYHYPMFTAGYKFEVNEEYINSGKPYFIRCTVLPPKDLLYPVLPTTIHRKQMYTLCHKCAEEGCSECNHSDADREFTDWFSSIEFELALNKGYTYRDVTDMITCTKPSSSIFKKYIGDVYQAKESSTGETRKFHKMRLNSCFGKFAQTNNKTGSVIVHDRFEGARYLDKKPRMTEIKDAYLISYTAEEILNKRSNVLVAAWITAIGRYKVYNLIEQALAQGCTPLYCNTDSLFVEGRFEPKDELSFGIKCEGVYERFRCLAPNYYSLDNEVTPKNLSELKEVYETIMNKTNYTTMEIEQMRVIRRLTMRHPKRLEEKPYGYK